MPHNFTRRYGDRLHARQCQTEGCHATTTSMSPRCAKCANRLRRYAHPLQSMPIPADFASFIRRAQEQRGALTKLNVDALKAHWDTLASTAAGEASPTYAGQRRLTYNKTHREACGIIRDLSEVLSFTRILDLATACHLHQLERSHFYQSEEAARCVMVETFRRAGHIGRHIVSQVEDTGGIARSYRAEILKPVRLEVAKLLLVGVGQAAAALAKLAHTRAQREAATQRAYYNSIQAISAIAAQ